MDFVNDDKLKAGRLFLMASFLEERITVIDAGARGGLKQFDATADYYKSISHTQNRLHYIGFEPDLDECEALDQEYAEDPGEFKFVPLGLTDKPGTKTIRYVAAEPSSGTTGPLGIEDTRKLTCPLPALEVASREESFVRLDDWMNENAIGRADFLKLDVEGSEVHVLRGAEKTLGDVRVVLSEVNFNDWISSHFSQVDSLLRENGFLLWRLGNLIHHRLYSDLYRSRGRVEVSFYNSTMTEHADPGGMLFQGYGYWIKTDLVHKPPSSVQQALRDAILAEACGFSDLAGTLLSKCDSLPFDLDKVYVPERVPQFV